MRINKIKALWSKNECAINAWLAIGAAYSAEGVSRQNVDCVTVDLQHGMTDVSVAIGMLQAISTGDAVPFVRVGSNDDAAIMKVLDAGCYGVICPMISTAEEAHRFGTACRYPPRGRRSYGPARGLLYGGADYFDHANDEILTLAMIETKLGIENIDSILDVEEIDAIYVGPNDLALAMGERPGAESADSQTSKTIAYVLERAHARKKKAGIFCSGGEAAARRRQQGFDLVTIGNDFALLTSAVRRAADLARGEVR